MTYRAAAPIGLALGSRVPPRELSVCKEVEAARLSELWLAEDYFYTGGVAAATYVLSNTRSIPVGVGVFSALTRQPALLAMEISTMAALFPGRFHAGIGLGFPFWMEQMDVMPESPMGAVRDCVQIVKRLLAGETVSGTFSSGRYEDVRLEYPSATPTPILVGGYGPRLLRLSGEIGDGTLIAFMTSPDYVRWAVDQVAAGLPAASNVDDRSLPVLALFSMDLDGVVAKKAARRRLASSFARGTNTLTDLLGISEELDSLLGTVGAEGLAEEMPESWVDRFAVAGDPEECEMRIRAYLTAGATSVVLFPVQTSQVRTVVAAIKERLTPRFRQ